MKGFVLTMVSVLLCTPAAFAAIQGEEVTYQSGDTKLKGYLAFDDSVVTPRPGVLVVHEWWGHNDYARKRARMLAELGYVALAVDMYGDGKHADHPDNAAKFMQEATANAEVSKDRFLAGYELLKNSKFTDPNQMAAIGYCFGGSTVLKMALSGIPLAGVVSFHGSLPQVDAAPGTVKAKMLVAHGGDDHMIPPDKVEAFKDGLEKAGVDYQFEIYEGAKHSFTNPDADELAKKFGMPIAYHAAADQQSWQDMQGFFNRIFQKSSTSDSAK